MFVICLDGALLHRFETSVGRVGYGWGDDQGDYSATLVEFDTRADAWAFQLHHDQFCRGSQIVENFPDPPRKRGRGRPKSDTPALTPAEKQKRYRERLRARKAVSRSASLDFTAGELVWAAELFKEERNRLRDLVARGSELSRSSMEAADAMYERLARAYRDLPPAPEPVREPRAKRHRRTPPAP